jgi:hypothetical protein
MPNSSEFDFAPAWRPEPGDIIRGVVEQADRRVGNQFDDYNILTLKLDEGERARTDDGWTERASRVAVHCFHTALINQMRDHAVRVGAHLGVQYRGRVQKQGGIGSYEGYRVRRYDSAPRHVDWGSGYGDFDDSPPDVPPPLDSDPGDDGPIPFLWDGPCEYGDRYHANRAL